MQPAQKSLLYFVTPSSGAVTVDIDIAKDLSIVNRRSYRQGMQYAVAGVSVARGVIDAGVTHCTLFTAGNTWVVHNAWKKAQAHWIAQQRRARRLIGQSAKPTWEDFKVTLDDNSTAAISVMASDGGVVGAGEWEYSRLLYEIDNNTVYEPLLHLIGPDDGTTKAGLILAYQQSRATVQDFDPDLPGEYSTNLYALMAADQDAVADEVADNMEFSNDEPPYDQNDYPGNDSNADCPWNQGVFTTTLAKGVGNSNPLTAECGLLRLQLVSKEADLSANSDIPHFVHVHLMPGPYKGVMARPMGQ